ncbi:MAG: hypothetical protein J6R23_05750 [Spirochaetales bacterium]|nr:hypothetical protein [Spirochaetales bacterium]
MLYRAISLFLVIMLLASCSLPIAPPAPSSEELMSESARMLNRHYDMVRSIIMEHEDVSELVLQETLEGDEIVRGLLNEEKGQSYLNFFYNSDKYQSEEDVYKAVSGLIPDDELEKIKDIADGLERALLEDMSHSSKALSATQKTEFYKDLRALVVKSVVLLTSAIVYAFLPDYMIFAKVSAASAVAIAAGVLSSTILAIAEWKDSGVLSTNSDNFEAWLQEVTKEPTAAWAISAGMIATGKAVNAKPVTTAVAIAVFALYGVTDDLAEMLKTYNFKIPV